MRIVKRYVSLAEECLLGAAAIVYPQGDCGLRCKFCALVEGGDAEELLPRELAEWLLASGADSLLWCGVPDEEEARAARRWARGLGAKAAFVFKGNGNESPGLLARGFGAWFDVYLPDLKFGDGSLATALCGKEYVSQCALALRSAAEILPPNKTVGGLLKRGLLARHLILPGLPGNAERVIALFAPYARAHGWPLHLNAAYAPVRGPIPGFDALSRLVSQAEHAQAALWARERGIALVDGGVVGALPRQKRV